MKARLFSIFIAACLVILFSAAAIAQITDDTFWARNAPTIDGTIEVDEWWGGMMIHVTDDPEFYFYMKSDGQYLYLAWDVYGDTTETPIGDRAIIYFDNDNDDNWVADCATAIEGAYFIFVNSGPTAEYRPQAQTGPCTTIPATAVTAGVSFASGHWMYEAQVDMSGGELFGAPGSTIGFFVGAFDSDFTDSGLYPAGVDWTDPSTYSDLTYAVPPPKIDAGWAHLPPSIDGAIDPAEWAGADTINVNAGPIQYTAHYLADARYLYVAVDVPSDTNLAFGDEVGFYFDNDYNGAWPYDCGGVVEGNYWLRYDTYWSQEWAQRYSNTYGDIMDCMFPIAPDNILNAASDASGHVQMEFLLDYTAGELYGDPSAMISFFMYYGDDAHPNSFAAWPDTVDAVSTWKHPAYYGTLQYPDWANSEWESMWADAPPTIDGTIGFPEWTPARVIQVRGELDYDLYIMSDGDYLYASFDVLSDATLSDGDGAAIYFDADNDGAWPVDCYSGTDGIYRAIYNAAGDTLTYETFFAPSNPCPGATPTGLDITFGQTVKGNVQVELRADFDSGEFFGGQDETIGLRFDYFNIDIITNLPWPYESNTISPDEYSKLTFASCPGCFIDSVCHPDQTVNPANECQICDIAHFTDDWYDNDGIACTDDGLWCTGDETCLGGACVGEYDTVNPRCSDDGLYCTGDESCDEDNDACVSTGDPCDGGEVCNEDTESCDPAADDDDDDDASDDDDDDQAPPDDDDTDSDNQGPNDAVDDDDDDGGCCGG